MQTKAKLGAILLLTSVVALPASAVTQRDNDVYFALTGVQAFSFTDSQNSVHSKQPWGGVTSNVSRPGAEGQIRIKAGREGSKAVAQWFKSKVGAGQTLVCDSKGNLPDELNFAAEGTLTFSVGGKTIICNDVLVGQGHFASANNWWMGGPAMKGAYVSFTGGTIQLCRGEGLNLPVPVTFTPQTPCSNHFNISAAPVN